MSKYVAVLLGSFYALFSSNIFILKILRNRAHTNITKIDILGINWVRLAVTLYLKANIKVLGME